MNFKSNGKLLISGEYTVLDGSLAFALPTKFGQKMEVKYFNENNTNIYWKAFDYNNNCWFECTFDYKTFKIIYSNNEIFSQRLIQIFQVINNLNPDFLNSIENKIQINTFLEFPNNWGLGSSSTLINNLANWAQIDEFKLLEKTFGGSGYDLACAKHNTPILYQIREKEKLIQKINFNPKYKEHLYFLHLNKKQNSRTGIKKYREKPLNKFLIEEISLISKEIIKSNTLDEFSLLLEKHEELISNYLEIPKIKNELFPDFEGKIKSLGAWGGDFILVVSKKNPKNYFETKNYHTLLKYNEIIL